MSNSQVTAQTEPATLPHLLPETDDPAVTGTILVVDDSPSNLHLLVKMLVAQGYRVRVATDGQQAIASAEANPPDLLLLDVMMPGLDGYEVCRRLKAQAETRDIPILFLSALTQPGHKVEGFASGGVDYITKPFQTNEVLARVATHLALQRASRALQDKTSQLERANAELAREIAERTRAEDALRQTQAELVVRVQERTAELSASNAALRAEIAERNRAELALKENEARYRTLFENARDAIIILHGEYLIECNSRTLEMLNCTREQIVGQTLSRFSPLLQPDGGDLIEQARKKIAEALAGEPQQFEWQYRLSTGTLLSAEVSLNRIELSGQLFLQAIIHDITERKKAEQQIQQLNAELLAAYDATLEGWAHALDLRDKETEGHSQRVVEMTIGLARALGLGEPQLTHLRRGALLHDIGKMGLPDHILFKPDKLDAEEKRLMNLHPVMAYDMLSRVDYLKPALDIPYCHHEKWDGTGYPRGLKGEEIPLAARIFAIVDVWDALRSDRIYRRGWTAEQTREYILSEAGKYFDPQLVPVFLSLVLDPLEGQAQP